MGDIMDEGFDPFSQEIGHQNILTAGLSGDGKTFLAGTMPGRVAYLLVETQGLDNLKQAIVYHKRDPKEFRIFPVKNHLDPDDPKGRRLLKNAAGKPLTAMQYVKDKLSRWSVDPEGFDSIVIDSVTALQELEKFWIQSDHPRMTRSEWGEIISDVTDICIRLRDLRMHTMAIFTSTVIQDEESRLHQRLSVFGQKLPTDLPRYFNIAVTMASKTDRETGEQVHRTITKGDERFITKGHLALDAVEIPDVRTWFSKMSNFWGDHAQGNVPTGGEKSRDKPAVEPKNKLEERLADPKTQEFFSRLVELGEELTDDRKLKAVKKYRSDEKLWDVLGEWVAKLEKEAE